MPGTSVSNWKKKFGQSISAFSAANPEARRTSHGGRTWSMPLSARALLQPQDGAVDKHTKLASIQSHLHSNLLSEPEDATLTGGTRSLSRRLLGLNVGTIQRKRPSAVVLLPNQTQAA